MDTRFFIAKACPTEKEVYAGNKPNYAQLLLELEMGLIELANNFKSTKIILDNYTNEYSLDKINHAIISFEATLNLLDDLYQIHGLLNRYQIFNYILLQTKAECTQYKKKPESLLVFMNRYKAFRSVQTKMDSLYQCALKIFADSKDRYLEELAENKYRCAIQ